MTTHRDLHFSQFADSAALQCAQHLRWLGSEEFMHRCEFPRVWGRRAWHGALLYAIPELILSFMG